MLRIRGLGETRTIAIVDDDCELLQSASRFFTFAGFRVRAFSNPVEAQAALREHRVDVVVTDDWMPELTGAQLSRALRDRWGADAPPVLGLCGGAAASEQVSLDYDSVLTKPCEPERLLSQVQRLTLTSPSRITSAEFDDPDA